MSTRIPLTGTVFSTESTPDAPIVRYLFSLSSDHPRGALAQFRFGVRSLSYLADHGFQDMVVLPGAFYIEMALSVEWKLRESIPRFIRKIRFNNPVILSSEDTVIDVEVSDQGNGCAEYIFYEAPTENASTRRYAATLEIDRRPAASMMACDNEFSIETFQQESDHLIGSEEFYESLRKSGNHYGPSFQNVSAIWRSGDQCLGKVSRPQKGKSDERPGVHVSLLDSITQLLACFCIEKRDSLILRSIGELELMDLNLPDILWAHAIRLRGDGGDDKGVLGDIRVSDRSGRPYLRLSDVAFTLLHQVASEAGSDKANLNLVVAANFTTEPIDDVLRFWGEHFGLESKINFAPYNQVFQQLLDTGSAFHKNSDGINAILLSLEEWMVQDKAVPVGLRKPLAENRAGSQARYVLPNGLEIAHLNAYETEYLYKEIFEEKCYLRHGIGLPDGATVVDIGANIGVFSLFVMSRCKNAKIYAFEPAPLVYDLLNANVEPYGSDIRAFNLGVSDQAKGATFTFYEKSSVFSGFHCDESEDREAIQAVIRNMLNSKSAADESMEEYVNELIADRLRCTTHECQLTTVSEIIRENQIDTIDLLKIDAEKSELDIIKGIDDGDWPKVKQIVLEIHDRTGDSLKRIEQLLTDKGFRCSIEQETLLDHAGLFNLYAVQNGAGNERDSKDPGVIGGDAERVEARQQQGSLMRNIREFCGALRSFMNQTDLATILCLCPRSPAAYADADLTTMLDRAEAVLLADVQTIANVHTIPSALLMKQYPVVEYYDSHSHELAHIPYTSDGYTAIGTALTRAIFNLNRHPYKVVVLDCDNTLWKGVCGEDGLYGIEVTPAYRTLQEFMIRQMNDGMLLCLCSKNNESDALDVFDHCPQMLLRREHFVSWRINWNRKSENIESLAKELNLGLDSFIFIDDNPIDCAEVKINCPEVLTLQLPENSETFESFFRQIWAFDHGAVTEEDRSRTKMYQEGVKRQQYLDRSLSLGEFIKGLDLRIEITEATEDQLSRISQQTLRTNQFNFTTIRRSEQELKALLSHGDTVCLVVRVIDRFGDYGLVGVVIYELDVDQYKIDTFLLSCRVLGRGVEHAVLACLGKKAVAEGKQSIQFRYVPTGKNLPALEFITTIGEPYRNSSGMSWTFPAERLALVTYDPDQNAKMSYQEPEGLAGRKQNSESHYSVCGPRSDRMQRIGEELYEVGRLRKAIEKHRRQKQSFDVSSPDPATPLEATLSHIWRRVLGSPQVGINDRFFDVGGTSLRAVQVIAAIKKELNQSLPITSLFEYPTISLLAAKLSGGSEKAEGKSTAAATERGQQRRYHARSRTIS